MLVEDAPARIRNGRRSCWANRNSAPPAREPLDAGSWLVSMKGIILDSEVVVTPKTPETPLAAMRRWFVPSLEPRDQGDVAVFHDNVDRGRLHLVALRGGWRKSPGRRPGGYVVIRESGALRFHYRHAHPSILLTTFSASDLSVGLVTWPNKVTLPHPRGRRGCRKRHNRGALPVVPHFLVIFPDWVGALRTASARNTRVSFGPPSYNRYQKKFGDYALDKYKGLAHN